MGTSMECWELMEAVENALVALFFFSGAGKAVVRMRVI